MTPAAIDADAIHCIRTFGLIAELEGHLATAGVVLPLLICTGYVARHELNPIAGKVAEWEASGLLRIEDVLARSPASQTRRALQERHRGMDKGEAEMIAWILSCSPSTPFVSCDVRALAIARRERVQAWDVLDLVHEWLASRVVTLEAAHACLASWVDDPKARWRPRGFRGIEPTLRDRYGRNYLRPLASGDST